MTDKVNFKVDDDTFCVHRCDLDRVTGDEFLNDTVVDIFICYLLRKYHRILALKTKETITPRSVGMVSSLAVERIVNKRSDLTPPMIDFKKFELVILPLPIDGHWCLFVYSVLHDELYYLDSMEAFLDRKYVAILSTLRHWIRSKCPWAKQISCYRLFTFQQMDSFNCGVYMLMNVEAILRQHSEMRSSGKDNFKDALEEYYFGVNFRGPLVMRKEISRIMLCILDDKEKASKIFS